MAHPKGSRVLDRDGVWRCSRGHDKDRDGTDPSGRCLACNREDRPWLALKKSLATGKEFRGMRTSMPNLKRVRLHLGLSQEQLANLAGISRAEISYAERGLRRPGFTVRQKLLAVIAPALARQERLHVK